jgi:hypothetical protein
MSGTEQSTDTPFALLQDGILQYPRVVVKDPIRQFLDVGSSIGSLKNAGPIRTGRIKYELDLI